MQQVPYSFRRDVEWVVRVAFVVGEFEGCGPSPAETGELEVPGRDGAFGGAPGRLERIGESGVEGVYEVRGGDDVGFVRCRAPCFEGPAARSGVAWPYGGVTVE